MKTAQQVNKKANITSENMEDSDSDCVICFERVTDGSEKTSCCHQPMHTSCKKRWLITTHKYELSSALTFSDTFSKTCPVCRSALSFGEYASILNFSRLHMACAQKDLDSVRRIVSRYQQFDSANSRRDIFSRTALHVAIESGDVDIVKELLPLFRPLRRSGEESENGSGNGKKDDERHDVNSKTDHSIGGMSALHIAACKVINDHEIGDRYVKITRALLKHGAAVHQTDASGHTPLHLAVRGKDVCTSLDESRSSVISVWDLLIRSGGEEAVNAFTQGEYELHPVALMKNARTLKAFLTLCASKGVRLDVSSPSPNTKMTAFGTLCLRDDAMSAITLLDSDVPVDTNSAFGKMGLNALEYATFLGHALLANILLMHPKSKSQFSQESLMRALINSMKRRQCDVRDAIIGSGLIPEDAWVWLLYARKTPDLSMRIAVEYEKLRVFTNKDRRIRSTNFAASVMRALLPSRTPLYAYSER